VECSLVIVVACGLDRLHPALIIAVGLKRRHTRPLLGCTRACVSVYVCVVVGGGGKEKISQDAPLPNFAPASRPPSSPKDGQRRDAPGRSQYTPSVAHAETAAWHDGAGREWL